MCNGCERYGVVRESDGRYSVIDKRAERFKMTGSRAAAHREARRLNMLHMAADVKAEPVCCPYCNSVAVELTEEDDESATGDCTSCGEHVEYDYNPEGIVAFRDGKAVYHV